MNFDFEAPLFEIAKSYRDKNGQMYVEGIASTTDIDETGERMSSEAIAKMAARLPGKPLRDEHDKGWYDKLGEIVKADVIDQSGKPSLWIKARLFDWSSKAKDLFKFLQAGGKLGLSVAGKFSPGQLVNELDQHLGKFVPTYKDVDPTEVSITDHPANLETFALAVAKSLKKYSEAEGVSEIKKDVIGANETKSKEYKDVATEDFLDPENFKYPADEAHLMPALRYFNHEGQRTAGGYSESKWGEMGRKLASKLTKQTGDKYEYNEKTDQVEKVEKKKSEEVTTMKNGLVSKTIPADVAGLIAAYNPGAAKELEVKKTDTSTDSSTSTSFPSMSSMDDSSTSTGSDTSTDKADTETTSTETETPSSSELSSVLSEIASTLKELKSSMGSTSTSTPTSTESTASEEEDELSTLCSSLKSAYESIESMMSKRKTSTTVVTPSTETSTTSTPTSSTSTDSMSKAIAELASAIKELKKSQADSIDAPKARKGFAVEKKFSDQEVAKSQEAGQDMLKTLRQDPSISFNEVMQYRDFGILPAKYAEKK